MSKKILTKEGLSKLASELEDLKNNKRLEVIERIKTAKEYGDLSENAEYQEAKEAQAFIEGRIAELENIMKTATIVDDSDQKDVVTVGCQVMVDKNGTKQTFTIVGSTEADPANRKISLESPLGEALLGKKVSDKVEVSLPGGVAVYEIVDIK